MARTWAEVVAASPFSVLTYYINPKGRIIAHCWGTYPTRSKALTVKKRIEKSHGGTWPDDPVPPGGKIDVRIVRVWATRPGEILDPG